MNDFIRNLGLEAFAHHQRVEYFYLSLVCTLSKRLPTLANLRFVSSFVHLKGFEPITFRFVFGCSSVELKVHLVLLVGLEPASLKGQQILSLSCIANSTTGAYCVYNGTRTSFFIFLYIRFKPNYQFKSLISQFIPFYQIFFCLVPFSFDIIKTIIISNNLKIYKISR